MGNKNSNTAYVNDRETTIVTTEIYTWSDDQVYFYYSPALDIVGYGISDKEAKESFELVLKEFMDYTDSIPSTLDFDRFLWRKMATCFIENTRRSYGYACVFLFAIDHFSLHIEPVKPKRPGYNNTLYNELERLGWAINRLKKKFYQPSLDELKNDYEAFREILENKNFHSFERELEFVW